MAPDDPESPDIPDELRGKDLLSKPRAEIEKSLDPATLASLASWFERPSAAVIVEATEEEVADAKQVEVHLALQARIATDADPKLIAILERHKDVPDLLLPARIPVRAYLDETIIPAHIRAELDRTAEGAPSEAREFTQPPDITTALERDNAPQAILRDLFRPVGHWERRMEPVFDPEEAAPMYKVGVAMADLEKIEWIGSGGDVMRDARDRFTSIVREPWADHWESVQARIRADRAEREGGGS